MLLGFLSVVIMLLVAYVYWHEGLFTACSMCGNVFVAGLVAFNFWEPLADFLEPPLSGTFMAGFEDCLCLMILFCLTLGLLRIVTNLLAKRLIEFPELLQRAGGLAFGLITGYLLAGFLVCTLQTLPWHRNFMLFEPKYEAGPEHAFRRLFPPDRVWLALMHRAGAYAFSTSDQDERFPDATVLSYDKYFSFDKFGTFELRYARYRRYGDDGKTLPYQGEFAEELRGPR